MLLMHTRARQTAAFTLIELAVVLVIIGLLVGAIAGGTSLLRQSELQTVISDYGKYTGVFDKFRAQYGGPPGDIIDATNYWGDDAVSTSSCSDLNIDNGSPGTCNGNANGQVTGAERWRAWQQLVLAEYIEGNFTGVQGSVGAGGADHAVIGTNVPKSRISNTGWTFAFRNAAADAEYYSEVLNNYLEFGGPVAAAPTTAGTLTPEEAWQIDSKADNGFPGTGRIVTRKEGFMPNCAVDASNIYLRSHKGKSCALLMSVTLR